MNRLRQAPKEWWQKTEGLRTRLRRQLDTQPGQSTAAFLVGCGRSGTNMVARRLSRAWQVEFYNEGNPAAFNDYRFHSLMTVEALRRGSRARITLFKPILETPRTVELLGRFSPARALFVFRHYDDVINSSIKRFGPHNWPGRVRAWVEQDFAEFAAAPPPAETREYIRARWQPDLSSETAIALYWLFYNRLYNDLGLHRRPEVHLVQYEQVVYQPEAEFQKMSNFLGIQYSAEMVEGVNRTSIRRDPAPSVSEVIREDCEALFQRLSQQARDGARTAQDKALDSAGAPAESAGS